jgi:hypothetical protein
LLFSCSVGCEAPSHIRVFRGAAFYKSAARRRELPEIFVNKFMKHLTHRTGKTVLQMLNVMCMSPFENIPNHAGCK